MSKNDSSNETGTNGNTTTYDTTWTDRPCTGIAIAIAEATGREPTDGPALDEYVDTDALDHLVMGDTPRLGGPIHVSFSYDGMSIFVDSGGRITIRSTAEGDQ